MGNDDGFVGAILASPEDEILRSVYADWLEDRDDPRGAFLRLLGEWEHCWDGGGVPSTSLTARLEELRNRIDPGWVAVMSTLGVKSEPFALWLESSDAPLTERLVIRGIRRRYQRNRNCQPGGLVAFATQYLLREPPDNGLTTDLQMLADLSSGLGECYYGSSDFIIYSFIADLHATGEQPTAGEILTALKARDFRGEGSGEHYEDFISNEYRRQHFFIHDGTEESREIHTVLAKHIAPARMWYVLLRTRNQQCLREAVHFAVGPSPHGNRIVGVVAGGFWG